MEIDRIAERVDRERGFERPLCCQSFRFHGARSLVVPFLIWAFLNRHPRLLSRELESPCFWNGERWTSCSELFHFDRPGHFLDKLHQDMAHH